MRYLTYDFSRPGEERKAFYAALDKELSEMHADGGISLLINNVGIANDVPRSLEEFTDTEVEDMIQCNIFSTVYMTRAVFKYMKVNIPFSLVLAPSFHSCSFSHLATPPIAM